MTVDNEYHENEEAQTPDDRPLNTEEVFPTPKTCVNCGQDEVPLDRNDAQYLEDVRFHCPGCGYEWGMNEEMSPARLQYTSFHPDHRERVDFASPMEM